MPERKKRRRRRRIGSFPHIRFLPKLSQLSRPKMAILIGSIVVAVVLTVILWSYGLKGYNEWAESRWLKSAAQMLQQEDHDGAIRAAQQALELDPGSLPAFHILAEATEKQNRVETVAWRAQIARLLPQNLDSQLNLASAALRFGELDTARRALANVPPNDRNKAAYHVVAGWLARAQGDEAGLEQHFAAAVKEDPKNELYQFNLAVLQIKSAENEKKDAARATLEHLSKSSAFRTGALRALLNDAVDRHDLAAADGIAQDLQMSQQVTFGDYLLCLNLYRKLDQKKFAGLLEKVKPVAARNPSDLAMLMDWMNTNGLAADVLKWTEKLPSEVTTKPPAAVAIAEAFAEVKNWSRLKRWTRGGSWGDSDYLRLGYQAFAARQLRQGAGDAEFDSLWRSAERATSNEPQRELNLARLAAKWNLPVEAEQLWLQVAKTAPNRREALDALTRIYRTNNDLPNLYRTMQRLHESSPNEADAAANYARLALLLEQNAEEGHRLAKEAHDRAPANVNCAVTYAFSLYGLGRTAEGLEIIKKLPNDQLHDPHAAVYVAVLLLDENHTEAAKEFIDAARQGQIYLEEKKLLDEAMIKTTASPTPAPAARPVVSPIPTAAPAPASKPTTVPAATPPSYKPEPSAADGN